MKITLFKFTCLLALALSANSSFGQNVDSLFRNYQKIEVENTEQRKLETSLYDNYFSTVLTYFDLQDQYSTPLKETVFKSSSEYKSLSDSLVKIKNGLSKLSYIELNLTPSRRYVNGVEYDLKRSGLSIMMSSKSVKEVGISNNLDYLTFSNLTFTPKTIYPQLGSLATKEEYLFLPLSKKLGVDYEDSNNETKLYILFLPTKNSKTTSYIDPVNFDREQNKYIICTAKKMILTINDKIVYSKEF